MFVRTVSKSRPAVERELEANSPENGNDGAVGEQAPSGPAVPADDRLNAVDNTLTDEHQLYCVIPDEPNTRRSSLSASPVYQPGSRGYYTEGLVVVPDVQPLQRSLVAPVPVYNRLNQTDLMRNKAETFVKCPYAKLGDFVPVRRFRNTL